VDLPLASGPTMATLSPFFILRLIFSKILTVLSMELRIIESYLREKGVCYVV
jgi:hypothetical protein